MAGFWLSPAALATTHPEFRVLYHEAIQIKSSKGAGAAERMAFDAYGRHFEMSLTPNERIRRGLAAGDVLTVPLEGTLDGMAGSWARVTRSPSGVRGMMFDGHEMFAIEPAADVAGSTVQPVSATDTTPVVYRLTDALMPLDTMDCEIALPEGTPTAAAAFDHVVHELSAQTAELAATKQVRVGVIGDFEFSTQTFTNGATPEDAIVARMNVVDGIFSSQLGVKVSLTPSTLFRTASDPFTKTKASDLLVELRNFRNATTAQKTLGLTHLMTGRDLDGDTVGIAYIGGLCDPRFGASLSQGTRGNTMSALIAAHEMGHNFGAPHDGEAGACQSTPQTFLMAPRLNQNDQYSACSLQQIQPVINTAMCLTAYIPPDAGIEVTNGNMQATVGTALVASFTVRATGDGASTDVSVTAALPAGLTLQSVAANGGTCTSGAGTATCALGTLAAGDQRQIDLNVTPTAAGALALELTLNSSNDTNASNDTSTLTITAANPSTAPVTPPSTGTGASTSSGGGGGGRVDITLLALLAVALLTARTQALASARARNQARVSARTTSSPN